MCFDIVLILLNFLVLWDHRPNELSVKIEFCSKLLGGAFSLFLMNRFRKYNLLFSDFILNFQRIPTLEYFYISGDLSQLAGNPCDISNLIFSTKKKDKKRQKKKKENKIKKNNNVI